jgi:hypothetical protein
VKNASCLALWTVALSLPISSGCAGPERVPDAAPREADVLDFRALAGEMWAVDGPLLTSADRDSEAIVRPAIAEFTVEYVATASGPKVDVSAGMMLQLPTLLYQSFVELMPEFNRASLPVEKVTGSEAYGKLEGASATDPELLEAAREREPGTRYPAGGLLALDDGQPDLEGTLMELLEETGADSTLRIRLRVSVRDGRATLEKGSVILWLGREGSAKIESKLTLVSPVRVIEEIPGETDFVALDSTRFVKAARGLFRPAIGLALLATAEPE